MNYIDLVFPCLQFFEVLNDDGIMNVMILCCRHVCKIWYNCFYKVLLDDKKFINNINWRNESLKIKPYVRSNCLFDFIIDNNLFYLIRKPEMGLKMIEYLVGVLKFNDNSFKLNRWLGSWGCCVGCLDFVRFLVDKLDFKICDFKQRNREFEMAFPRGYFEIVIFLMENLRINLDDFRVSKSDAFVCSIMNRNLKFIKFLHKKLNFGHLEFKYCQISKKNCKFFNVDGDIDIIEYLYKKVGINKLELDYKFVFYSSIDEECDIDYYLKNIVGIDENDEGMCEWDLSKFKF